MKYLMNFALLFSLVATFSMMSCDKDELTTDNIESLSDNFTFDTESGELESHKGVRRHCFNPVFPVTLEYADGTTEEVADQDAMIAALKAYKEANPGSSERPKIQFPFDIELKNGDIVTLESEDDLKEALENCKGRKGGKKGKKGKKDRKGNRGDCFEINFPVTLEYADGTTEEVADADAMKAAIKAWREANPGSKDRPSFVFPIDVTLENGDVVTVEDADGLKELAQDCRPERKDKRGDCFEINFPVTLEYADGTTEEVADADAMKAAIKAWHEANPGSKDRPSFVFPIDVTLENGDVVTVEDADGFKALAKDCGKKKKGGKKGKRGG